MEAPAGPLRDEQIARDGGRLRDRRLARQAEPRGDGALVHRRALGQAPVLRVLDDPKVEEARVLERAPQDSAVREPLPVVGDGDGARLGELAVRGDLLALLAARRGRDRVQPRAARGAAPGHDELAHLAHVVDGIGVRHRADGGEPAGRRRLEARLDRLRVLAAGLAQVCVQVDEAREDVPARDVEDLRVARLDPVADLRDDAVGEQHVEAAVASGGGIHEAAAAQQQRARHDSPSHGCPPSSR